MRHIGTLLESVAATYRCAGNELDALQPIAFKVGHLPRIVGKGEWWRANARHGLQQAFDSLANPSLFRRVQTRQARVIPRCDGSIEREVGER